jgi:uncharacterized membrane protein YqjE
MQNGNRSVAAVLSDIVGNVQDIVRSEMRLAKTELREELGKSRNAGILLGAGVLLLALGVVFLLLALVYALGTLMPAWAAALIVGGGVALIAAVCMGLGVSRLKTLRGLPRTASSVEENVQWAKQLTR